MTEHPEGAQVVASPSDELGHDKTLDVSAERVNSEAQTQHDPLCPWLPPLQGQGGTGPVTHYPCLCDFIAKVRADEREQAWIRVLKLCGHTKYVGCEPCFHDECATAARGEES